MKKLAKYIPVITAFTPMIVMAAVGTSLRTVIGNINGVISAVVPLLIGIALIVFIWGVIQYITAGENEEKRSGARNTIIYGIIGLFAIVAVWGLVNVLANTFGIDTGGTIKIPELPNGDAYGPGF